MKRQDNTPADASQNCSGFYDLLSSLRVCASSAFKHRPRKKIHYLALVFLGLGILAAADWAFPPPLERADRGYASVVLARDGTPLRAFADQAGIWRSPIGPEQVSPLYLQALIQYEDRWFYEHPGVNPFAMIRAGWQAVRHGRIISGGSTLTMQVARLLEPPARGTQRSLPVKLRQIARALQLERRLTKQEILSLYLNLAPFGGTIEGVETAARVYLGKSATDLSHGEAALLAVLPQAPSRMRPDRHPLRAQAARDKVLTRLAEFGVWNHQVVAEARAEQVAVFDEQRPQLAPLLARRLRPKQGAVLTTIDIDLQARLEELLRNRTQTMPQGSSAAILVIEHADMSVRAYLGSADFNDDSRFPHVDMVQASRSYGSTLKPFLFGLAIEDGLIHSQSLMQDVPMDVGGYRPVNFNGRFRGPVSATEALHRSLNIPAVDLVDRYGPAKLRDRLRQGGMNLRLPKGARPSAAIILGGGGARLSELTALYAALARNGLAAKPRYRKDDALEEQRFLDPGAAWITRTTLEANPPPRGLYSRPGQRLAWKTGTSYGFRDAWAFGVTDEYSIGVWVGRPNGTPSPGHYGAVTALPILFDVTARLDEAPSPGVDPPATVSKESICWPLGRARKSTPDEHCHEQHEAWILDAQIPPTLMDRGDKDLGLITHFRSDAAGWRIPPGCPSLTSQEHALARWPTRLTPWLSTQLKLKNRLPDAHPSCVHLDQRTSHALRITEPMNGATLRQAAGSTTLDAFRARAEGGEKQLYWLRDGLLVARTAKTGHAQIPIQKDGPLRLTVFDEAGAFDSIEVQVLTED